MNSKNISGSSDRRLYYYLGIPALVYILSILGLGLLFDVRDLYLFELLLLPPLLVLFNKNFDWKLLILYILLSWMYKFFHEEYIISHFSFFMPFFILILILKRRSVFEFTKNFLTIPFFLALASICLSFFAARDRGNSIYAFINHAQAVIFLVYFINVVDSRKRFHLVFIPICIAFFYPLLIGTYQSMIFPEGLRVRSKLMNYNEFGAYISFYIMVFTGVFFCIKNQAVKVAAAMIIVAAFFVLLNTYSRGALIAFGLSMLVYIYLKLPKAKRLYFPLAAGLILLIIIPYFVLFGGATYLDRFTELSGDSVDFAALSRLGLWRSSIKLFQTSPLIGIGLNNYEVRYPQYDPFYGIGKRKTRHRVAHNIYLNTLAEHGIVGFSFLIIIISVFWVNLKNLYKRAATPVQLEITSLFLTFFVYFLIHNMVDTLWTVYHHVVSLMNLMLYFGLVLVYQRLEMEPLGSTEKKVD